jgi:hypothetical protein
VCVVTAGRPAAADTLTATITYPANGAVNADLSQPIQWTPVVSAQAYYLYVGTTVGAKNLVNTGEIQTLSYKPGNLPAGQPLFVRIYTKAGGVWRFQDSTFSTAPLAATIASPVNSAVSVDPAQPIEWAPIANAQAYYLYVGTTLGAKDLVNTGEIQQTSVVAANLPRGQVLYARLHTEIGGVWRYTDTTFTVASLLASFTYPANGAMNVDSTQAIAWTTAANAQAYYLYVGTTPGAKDLVNTGEMQQTSYFASNLPAGQTIYARIYTKVGGAWFYSEETFSTAPRVTSITSPANGAVNVDVTQPIQWGTVVAAQAYYLYVGTTPGAKDLVNTGEIQQTSFNAPNLPPGQTLYARIYTLVANAWRYADTTFTTAPLTASITFPADGEVNADLTQPIRWTSTAVAQAYYLYVGTTPGAHDLVDTGETQQISYRAATLPSGRVLYARLYTKSGGAWRYVQTSFTAARQATALTYPVDGAVNVPTTVTMTWASIGNAAAYFLYVGRTPGADDLASSGETTNTAYSLSDLPACTVSYARLYTLSGGVWRHSPDVAFTAGGAAAEFVFPARGATGVAFDRPFEWTSMPCTQGYRLVVSSTPNGPYLLDTGVIHQPTFQPTSLPVDRTLYARVYTLVDGTWLYADSVFTAMSSIARAEPLYPTNTLTGADTGLPFRWTTVDVADAYRLELGTTFGAHDLHDSGPIRVTRRFVPDLPVGSIVYARLSTRIDGTWYPRDFTFTAGSAAITMATRIQNAFWATHAVRTMSAATGSPFIGTRLADGLISVEKDRAVCTDYAQELVSMLAEMNIGTGVRILDIAFNPNHYEAHTLVEMENRDTHQWMLLDPTFDLTANRTADGLPATAEDLSAATREGRWSDISYVFLGPDGDHWVRSYYIDYPLLFVNVYHAGTSAVEGSGAPILAYLDVDAVPAQSAVERLYTARCATADPIDLVVNGAVSTLECSGVDGVTHAFYATSVSAASSTTASLMLYRPRRFVF